MAIGDLVLFNGRRYILRGVDPMSLTERQAELEDPDTGARMRVKLDDVHEVEAHAQPRFDEETLS